MAHEIRSSERRSTRVRAFLPFWISIILGLVILSWDYHFRHAPWTRLQLRVTVEGLQPDENFSLVVDGQHQPLNDRVPLGFVNISISAPYTEVIRMRRFIWYGITDLGAVDLKYRRGSLTVRVVPAPDNYEIHGIRGSWTNRSGSFENIPAGRYKLSYRFGSLVEHREVEFNGYQTETIEIAANIGSLELSAQPSEGEFNLISLSNRNSWNGGFPASIAHLPSGSYQLVAKRPGYQRELNLEVRRNETNRFVVKFLYGSALFTTLPAGATIFWEGENKGKTPLTLNNLVPGTYRMETRLEGYDSLSETIKVDPEVTANFSATLVNTRYREAMVSAQQNLERKNYTRAAEYFEMALAAKPGDMAVSKLLPTVRAHGLLEWAADLERRNEFDQALGALDLALQHLPGDTEIQTFREKNRSAKARFEQQEKESRFHRLITEYRSAAENRDFQLQGRILAEAKQIFPDNPEFLQLEARFREGQSKRDAELKVKNRLDEIAARKQYLATSFEVSLRNEKDAAVFKTRSWNTSKTASELRAAIERVGKKLYRFRVQEFNSPVPHAFTAKIGRILPGFDVGSYVRMAAVTYEEGKTGILVMLVDYEHGIPEKNEWTRDQRLEQFRVELAAELGEKLN